MAPYPVRSYLEPFSAIINGKECTLEAKVYRPDNSKRFPLIIHSHGRNGKNPPTIPDLVNMGPELKTALAQLGYVVVFVVRRGYGNSTEPDRELKETALETGEEAAKDYQAALLHFSKSEHVAPGKVTFMGHSQGGWASLVAASLDISRLGGVVNLSGGTNYLGMGDGQVNDNVFDHWITACADLGLRARVPSLWIYSENDESIPGHVARRMEEIYRAKGGRSETCWLAPQGENGHFIAQSPELYLEPLKAFLQRVNSSESPRDGSTHSG